MTHNNSNLLAHVRNKAKVNVQDLALLVNMKEKSLLEMETGKRIPSPQVIAIYHILFKSPFHILFEDMYADLHSYIQKRSSKLISNLKMSKSSKSKSSMQRILRIVKLIDEEGYDELN